MSTNVIFRGPAEKNKPAQSEAIASEALAAGSLLVKSSGEFALHGTDGAGSGAMLYVADLNTLKQEDAATSVWAKDDTAVAFEPSGTERYNMLVATGQTLVVDSPLTSNGDGSLRLGVVGTDDILCFADEAVTTTAAGLVAVKFK